MAPTQLLAIHVTTSKPIAIPLLRGLLIEPFSLTSTSPTQHTSNSSNDIIPGCLKITALSHPVAGLTDSPTSLFVTTPTTTIHVSLESPLVIIHNTLDTIPSLPFYPEDTYTEDASASSPLASVLLSPSPTTTILHTSPATHLASLFPVIPNRSYATLDLTHLASSITSDPTPIATLVNIIASKHQCDSSTSPPPPLVIIFTSASTLPQTTPLPSSKLAHIIYVVATNSPSPLSSPSIPTIDLRPHNVNASASHPPPSLATLATSLASLNPSPQTIAAIHALLASLLTSPPTQVNKTVLLTSSTPTPSLHLVLCTLVHHLSPLSLPIHQITPLTTAEPTVGTSLKNIRSILTTTSLITLEDPHIVLYDPQTSAEFDRFLEETTSIVIVTRASKSKNRGRYRYKIEL